jgi:hypothetical protein
MSSNLVNAVKCIEIWTLDVQKCPCVQFAPSELTKATGATILMRKAKQPQATQICQYGVGYASSF